jgi:hypothetical protein
MTTEEINDTGDVFVADPDDFDEIEEFTPKPGWIKPIGVISIVWAAIGLLLGGLGVAWMFLGPTLLKSANMQGGFPDVMQSVNFPLAGAAAMGLGWAVLLLLSGILLMVMHPLARRFFLIYALGGIVLTLGSTWLNLDYQQQIAEWIKANPDADFSKQTGAGGGMIGLIIGIVLGLAWPVITLIIFGVIKTKPEQYTGTSPDVA